MDFLTIIKDRLTKLGWTQSQLADAHTRKYGSRCQMTIHRYLGGKGDTSSQLVSELLDLLDLTILPMSEVEDLRAAVRVLREKGE